MDLQGIGALSAAAVAAIGIPAALLVGRWQMRAAMHTANEAARAGIAQAETAYRAALDAVRAEAGNAHQQWHRGVRRDTYAAFLLATTRSVQAASALPEESIRAEELAAATARVRQERSDLTAALWTLRLEGPNEVAEIANRLCVQIVRLMDGLALRAECRRAQSELDALVADSQNEAHGVATELMEGLARLRTVCEEVDFWPMQQETPDEVSHQLNALREFYPRVHQYFGWDVSIPLLRNAVRDVPDPMDLDRQAQETIRLFIEKAQEAIGST
ncbi:hypothetical protein ACFCYB_15050 [Streptomyces sp. NPDC056309]|uniref:hypothetical protein n=1 Tax=unclassified Streptomyces TaxID=2593676 RepID=UPI0035D7E60B